MIDPTVSIVMRRELAKALLAFVDQNHSQENYDYIVDELRPVLVEGIKEKEEEKVYAPKKESTPLSDFKEGDISWSYEEVCPLFWVQVITNTPKGKSVYYELQYSILNGTHITLAQVAHVPDFGTWQAQFTCKVNRKITPVKTLAANIIQVSWIFGVSYDTVFEQLKPFGIFKTI